MPGGLDRADRKLLIGAGILLVGLILVSALLSPAGNRGGASFPSSYSNAWDGAKAAFLFLQESGYRVERWELSPTDLDEDSAEEVLIFAEPLLPPTSAEKARILRFLQYGGRVVATGPRAASLLPEAEHFAPADEYDKRERFPARLPSPLVENAPEIDIVPPKDWKPGRGSHLVIYGNKDTAAVITYRVGAGRVIWWGSDTPLINSGVTDAGNLALFLNSVAASRNKRILWDEYFHGARGSLWAYFAKTPLPWGAAQVALVFLAILATYSRRNGPIRMPAKVSRLSPLEFVETLGDLYSSAHAGSAAVQIMYQRLRFLLIRQLGLSVNVPAAELASSTSQALGWKEEALRKTLVQAEQAATSLPLDDLESLVLAQELFDYIARLEPGRLKKK
ncbi:MAG TPA: DUF4350 domain-containing protein [Candidatus Acidoferrum sp.]